MYVLYGLISLFITVVSIFSVVCIIIYVKSKKEDYAHEIHKYTAYICALSLFFTVILSAPVQEIFKLDNIELKPSGKYCYYVSVYDYTSKKSFTAPATINIKIGFGSNERYELEEIYTDKETYYFYEDNFLNINQEMYITNLDYDVEWGCTLLNERAYVEYKFDNGINIYNIISDLLKIISLLTVIILYIIDNKKKSSSSSE